MIKTWFIATRPWSFTAAAIPIALGAALAWLQGSFHLGLFFVTLVGGVCLQAGTNLINTYGDYKSGVDTVESAVTCPQLVTGQLTPQSMKRAGILAFSLALASGLYLTYFCGLMVLGFGILGIIAGYSYTAGICPYKYQGVGSIFVFFLMGPLMVWPSYFVQTATYSWLPVLVSLPISFLVAGILHGNDIRDFIHDDHGGIKTLALFLGFRNSMRVYYFLFLGAYGSLILLIVNQLLPWTALLPILLVPVLVNFLRRAYRVAGELEGQAAKFHFQFGLLFVIGIALFPAIGAWVNL